MANQLDADSVFAPGPAPPPRGIGLRAAAAAWMALAVLPALVLAALAWYGRHEGIPGDSFGGWLVLVAATCGLYALLLAWFGLRSLLRPLGQLAAAMREIEEGRYAGGAPGAGRGLREVAQLHWGLQRMWEGLERRGRERDAALEASNAMQERLRDSVRELSERERRYRELFESNPNAMWIYDVRSLKFLAVNDRAIAQYGYSREEFLAMRITDVRPPEDRGKLMAALKEEHDGMSFLGDAPRIGRHMTKDGRVLLAELTRHPTVFHGCAARLVMVSDVTARIAGESRLRRHQLQLATELAQAQGTQAIAQAVAAGVARLVQSDVLPRLAAGDALEPVLRRALRVAELASAMPGREPVDLSALAEREVTLLRLRDPRRRVHVEIEPGLRCLGDPALLAELLRELLGNAWDSTAMRAAPWVRVGRSEHAVGRFFISDNGDGFDAADQARLFLPFERIREQGRPPGYGLGLALAREVVLRHEGRLWADSRPGQGSTFFIELGPQVDDAAQLPRVQEVVIDSALPQE